MPRLRATTRTARPLLRIAFWDSVKLLGFAVADADACGSAAPAGIAAIMQVSVASSATSSFEVPLTLSPIGLRIRSPPPAGREP